MKFNETGNMIFEPKNTLEREVVNYVLPKEVQENIIKITGGSKAQKEAMNILREASRNVVDILDGTLNSDLFIGEELKEVLFGYEPTELLRKTQVFNDLRLEVPVIKINSKNEITVIKSIEFNTGKSEEVIIENIPEYIIRNGRIDIINKLINSELNKKLEINLCNTLNNHVVLNQSNNKQLKESISEALNKIEKVHQQNASIALSPSKYALYSDELKNLGKFDVVTSPYLNDIFIGNLNAIVVNFVPSKKDFDKDIHTGLYVAVQKLWTLNSAITDENAICKICDTVNS